MRTGLLRITFTALLCLMTTFSLAQAATDASLDAVLKADSPPPGVVFEIVTGREDSLNWALPRVKAHIKRLRDRFPALPVAIVSHGREMFSLRNNNKTASANQLRQISQQLVEDGVALHVCGTYAERRGLSKEDFPEFVNVAAEGPAQLNDYVAIGYIRIRVRKD